MLAVHLRAILPTVNAPFPRSFGRVYLLFLAG